MHFVRKYSHINLYLFLSVLYYYLLALGQFETQSTCFYKFFEYQGMISDTHTYQTWKKLRICELGGIGDCIFFIHCCLVVLGQIETQSICFFKFFEYRGLSDCIFSLHCCLVFRTNCNAVDLFLQVICISGNDIVYISISNLEKNWEAVRQGALVIAFSLYIVA